MVRLGPARALSAHAPAESGVLRLPWLSSVSHAITTHHSTTQHARSSAGGVGCTQAQNLKFQTHKFQSRMAEAEPPSDQADFAEAERLRADAEASALDLARKLQVAVEKLVGEEKRRTSAEQAAQQANAQRDRVRCPGSPFLSRTPLSGMLRPHRASSRG